MGGQQSERTTMRFVQVWLEVVAININNIAAVVRAGQTSLNIGSKYLSLSKVGQRFRAEGILMPHLHKALTLPAILSDTFHFEKLSLNI